jgi:ABC-type transporter Mla subunit MlaD
VTAPASRWKLGLFVVAGSAIGLLGVAFLGARELQRSTHTAYAYFDEALTGLEEGSSVKFRGVTVGRVERIKFASDKKHLEVQASLYDDYLSDLGLDASKLDADNPLTRNLRAQVVMSWVTSTAFIQVDYFPDPPRGPQLLPFDVPSDGVTLRTVPSTAKSLESSTREVLRELPRVASTVRELVDLLRTELSAARLPEVSRKLQSLLSKVEKQVDALDAEGAVAAATGALQEVGATAAAFREEREGLRATMAAWTELGRSLQREVEAMALDETSAGVRGAAVHLGGLAELRADVRAELHNLRRALAAVERLAAMLERDPGSLLRGRGASNSPWKEDK